MVLSTLVFTAAGVASGSMAASALWAAVAKGSLFAYCQSIGAAGLSSSTYGVAATTATIGV